MASHGFHALLRKSCVFTVGWLNLLTFVVTLIIKFWVNQPEVQSMCDSKWTLLSEIHLKPGSDYRNFKILTYYKIWLQHTHKENQIFFPQILLNTHTLQDLKIVAHHKLQDIIKTIMPEGQPHVISRSRSSLTFQKCLRMLASVLAAFYSICPESCGTSTHYTDSQHFIQQFPPSPLQQLVLQSCIGYCESADVIIAMIILI